MLGEGARLSAPVLEAKRVSKVFGSRRFLKKSEFMAVSDVSLRFDETHPQAVAVVGESGSGKTTLGRMLLGFLAPTSGSLEFHGTSVPSLTRADRKQFRREIQGIFQDPFESFNPFYRIDHVLRIPLDRFAIGTAHTWSVQIEEALHSVGLDPSEILGRYPHQLSGGQLQRVMVARALLTDPKVLIADEPVSMVDASLRATILGTLIELRNRQGISIVYITHDLTTAYHIADSVLVLYRGELVEVGDAAEIIQNPRHPYTQLLVNSVPWPDPDRPWGSIPAKSSESRVGPESCAFAPRCPHAWRDCVEAKPMLYQTSDDTGVRCFLFAEHRTMNDSTGRESTVQR